MKIPKVKTAKAKELITANHVTQFSHTFCVITQWWHNVTFLFTLNNVYSVYSAVKIPS